MLGGILGGLLTAFILEMLGLSAVAIEAIPPFIQTQLTVVHWCLIFGIIGGIGGDFKRYIKSIISY